LPRIRTIKPSFFQSDDVSALPLRARLTWIGLWTQCDDQGRTKDHARLIKAAIWPLDAQVSLADIEEDLNTLDSQGRIVRYEVNGQRYLEITNWSEHQKINRATESRIPPPGAGITAGSVNGHVQRTDDSPGEGKGREGKGRDARAKPPPATNATRPTDSEPPTKCEEHQKLRNPPNCGKCADARKRNDEWHTAKRERHRLAAKCPVHRGQLAHNCSDCRSEELSPA